MQGIINFSAPLPAIDYTEDVQSQKRARVGVNSVGVGQSQPTERVLMEFHQYQPYGEEVLSEESDFEMDSDIDEYEQAGDIHCRYFSSIKMDDPSPKVSKTVNEIVKSHAFKDYEKSNFLCFDEFPSTLNTDTTLTRIENATLDVERLRKVFKENWRKLSYAGCVACGKSKKSVTADNHPRDCQYYINLPEWEKDGLNLVYWEALKEVRKKLVTTDYFNLRIPFLYKTTDGTESTVLVRCGSPLVETILGVTEAGYTAEGFWKMLNKSGPEAEQYLKWLKKRNLNSTLSLYLQCTKPYTYSSGGSFGEKEKKSIAAMEHQCLRVDRMFRCQYSETTRKISYE